MAGCSFQKYVTKPVEPATYIAKLERKDPTSAEFNQYLLNNGYAAERLPIQQWGSVELTYCALFFHPSLDVARAQWRSAQSAEATVAERTAPTINGNIAHSDDSDPSKKPFAFGLSIDIPIDTVNKRNIRIENAQHLSQAAKLEIAQAAWQLRSNITQTLTEYRFNEAQLRLITEEELRRQEIANLYQKRVSAGAASNIELSNAKMQLQTVTSALNTVQQNKLVLRSKLASNTGLPLAKVETMPLELDNKRKSEDIPDKELQTSALLNRIDIRIALERYATAETKLKLEIAKQYPDIVISPGVAYEFGDNIWSLGLSGLLTLAPLLVSAAG
ncbi:MAG TPA: TolC family protein, partial [Methylophilaceae bacterium]|nr:TolC family protein [Methylophilaceae bacterium]